jgi:SAM-dependent methyltransferase
MHDTAMDYGAEFFNIYTKNLKGGTIVDIGSRNICGSLRSVAPPDNKYIGVDFAAGNGVDVVIEDPYCLPFADESADVVVSSSCFEHAEFFWLLFNEALRILKPVGLLYINAPANGSYHRYPVDCWRFYPDSGVALQNWGQKSGYNCAMLESFIGIKKTDIWHDFVAVFVKDNNHALQYTTRIQQHLPAYTNGRLLNSEEIFRYSLWIDKNPN